MAIVSVGLINKLFKCSNAHTSLPPNSAVTSTSQGEDTLYGVRSRRQSHV